ncbi:MAG TPA: hypothetical protein VKY74_09520 [Chloroflexia bacterium]|nr:hypothetical protein [Chloroflexia bacterium]
MEPGSAANDDHSPDGPPGHRPVWLIRLGALLLLLLLLWAAFALGVWASERGLTRSTLPPWPEPPPAGTPAPTLPPLPAPPGAGRLLPGAAWPGPAAPGGRRAAR